MYVTPLLYICHILFLITPLLYICHMFLYLAGYTIIYLNVKHTLFGIV